MTTDFRYEPNWDSLQNYEVPQWFMDDKLGIFIHWGPYSVPAFDNEWYPRFMYRDEISRKGPNYHQHHTKTWGHPSKFGYKDFIPLFKAENWDPAQWLDLFQKAGARYIVPVAEHHDGFPMYASTHTRWNAALMGPSGMSAKSWSGRPARPASSSASPATAPSTGATTPTPTISTPPIPAWRSSTARPTRRTRPPAGTFCRTGTHARSR